MLSRFLLSRASPVVWLVGRRADILMPVKESEAIVLQSYPLGEADRLVSFLSRPWGRLRGVARGARRPRSRFGSTLESLSHIRLWFYERETRQLVRINQAELIESFLDAQCDYGASVALALLAEITEAVLPEREPSDAAFRLILLAARTIKRTRKVALPVAYFSLWTVRLGGWLPPMDRCTKCGSELGSQGAWVTLGASGLCCASCRTPGMRALSAATLASARRMLEQGLDRLVQNGANACPNELGEYLLDLIEHQIEHKLNARRMLELAK